MAHLTVQNIAMELTEPWQGDLSFEQLVAMHEPRMRRLAHRLLGWRDGTADVDDIMQDVFLAALRNLPKFRGESTLSTWLTTVTINRCRAHRRKQFLRLRWLRAQQPPAAAPAASDQPLADDAATPVPPVEVKFDSMPSAPHPSRQPAAHP